MNWLLIYVLLAVCLWLIGMGMRRRGGVYEYPFLAGATFLFFVLPQLPALANDPFLPPGSFAKAAAFSILCAAMCGVGWAAGKRPMIGMTWAFDERRLLWVAAILSLIGAFFYFKLSRLPNEMRLLATYSTGLPVAYLFIARLIEYGFAISVLCFLRRPSMLALVIILYDASFYYMDRIARGRRAAAAEFFILIALALWFHRRIAVPRLLAVVAILAAALAIPSTGSYRAIARDRDGPTWSELMSIDVWGNFKDRLQEGGFEMRNAVQRIDFVDETQSFDYGSWHWNMLVFNFVPAQILGSEFKDSLMIPLGKREFNRNYESQIISGTTNTGMADAFASFWYFGAVKFFVVAYLLSRIYRAAAAGNTVYQIVYMISLTPSMHVITHETQWLFSTWVYTAVLFLPLLALAKIDTPFRRSARQAASGSVRAPSAGLRVSAGLQ